MAETVKDNPNEPDKNEEERAILLAASAKGTRLLPYSLTNIEELIELAHFLLDQHDVPEEIRGEFENALRRFG